jgi:outer membrane protein assembly factor BamB
MLKLAPDGSSVAEVWKNAFLDPKIGGVVVLNGRIYGGGDRNRKLFCVDWKTGNEIYSSPQLAPCNIIADDGLLYIYSERGTVNLVEPKSDSFNIISSFPVPLGAGTHWAHLVINNKRLYVRHGAYLMVYDIAAAGK